MISSLYSEVRKLIAKKITNSRRNKKGVENRMINVSDVNEGSSCQEYLGNRQSTAERRP